MGASAGVSALVQLSKGGVNLSIPGAVLLLIGAAWLIVAYVLSRRRYIRFAGAMVVALVIVVLALSCYLLPAYAASLLPFAALPVVLAALDDRPVVVVSGHFGNFEVGGVISGLLGFPTYSIARPLDNPLLDRFVNGFRGRTGQFILSKIGSAPQIDAIMRSGGTIALTRSPCSWVWTVIGQIPSAARTSFVFSRNGTVVLSSGRRGRCRG